MKGKIPTLKIVLILLIAAFTAISAFGCFAIVGKYMVDQDLFVAGDTFVKETMSNSFILILICSIVQVVTLFFRKKSLRMVSLAVSAASSILTIAYVPLYNAGDQVMGGLVSYSCEITWCGYVAIGLSVVIFLIQIGMFLNLTPNSTRR